MNKSQIITRLEDTVRTLKEQLDKNDGSGLSAMAVGAKAGFDNLKSMIASNEKARLALDSAKIQALKLEEAIREGDKKLSAKTVVMMEKAVRELKDRLKDKDVQDKNE